MTEYTGSIEKISLHNNNGNDKVVIHLNILGHVPRAMANYVSNTLFVEFQGSNIKKTKNFREGDEVCIGCYHNGKVSKLGRLYNNIVGYRIKPINNYQDGQ